MTPNLTKLFEESTPGVVHINAVSGKENEYRLRDQDDNYPDNTSNATNHANARKLTLLATHGRALVEMLTLAQAKLAIGRRHATGEYHGGMEHGALMRRIDHLLATLEQEAGQ